MTSVSQYKEQILELITSVIALAGDDEGNPWVQSLRQAQQCLEAEEIYVVFCGEFKQGKSSLINAFLEEVDLFPISVDITTNMITMIRYEEVEKVEVNFQQAQETVVISRSEIPDYVTEQKNKENYRKANSVLISSPNPKLKDGIVLVDTPGIGGLNREHTHLTESFLSVANIVIFVSDIYSPLKDTELKFLGKHLKSRCESTIFVLTKIDSGGDFKAIVEDNRKKLAMTLEQPEEEICIVPVSSVAKRDYLEFGDVEDLKFSQFPLLEQKFYSLMEKNRSKT